LSRDQLCTRCDGGRGRFGCAYWCLASRALGLIDATSVVLRPSFAIWPLLKKRSTRTC
jgi:hypothetical protein